MPLDNRPLYPRESCYVLKLHRDCEPGAARLHGVLEHLASGEVIAFQSPAALGNVLLAHLRRIHAAGQAPETGPGG